SISSTFAGRTSKSTPSCSRIARRWGERLAKTRPVGFADLPTSQLRSPSDGRPLRWSATSQIWKEQGHLARRGLVGVRAVDHVLADLEREVAADRAGSRLERVGRPDDLARRGHRLVALEHHRNE